MGLLTIINKLVWSVVLLCICVSPGMRARHARVTVMIGPGVLQIFKFAPIIPVVDPYLIDKHNKMLWFILQLSSCICEFFELLKFGLARTCSDLFGSMRIRLVDSDLILLILLFVIRC